MQGKSMTCPAVTTSSMWGIRDRVHRGRIAPRTNKERKATPDGCGGTIKEELS